jgi:hypothetical protein
MLHSRPLVVAALCASPAVAQPVPYELRAGSSMRRELCLPPCLCPPLEQNGPLQGDFHLTLLDSSPLFTRYTLTNVAWTADLDGEVTAMSGAGIYTIGGEVALVHRLELDLSIGPLTVITPFDSGFVPVDPQHPFPAFAISTTTGQIGCRRETLRVIAGPACYANCDGSTSAPVLNVADFTCFLHRFAEAQQLPQSQQQSHYANCDRGYQPPVLNIADFTCFLHQFAAGCP